MYDTLSTLVALSFYVGVVYVIFKRCFTKRKIGELHKDCNCDCHRSPAPRKIRCTCVYCDLCGTCSSITNISCTDNKHAGRITCYCCETVVDDLCKDCKFLHCSECVQRAWIHTSALLETKCVSCLKQQIK